MNSENRNKRDLPEVVAEILITLDRISERQGRMEHELGGLRQEMGHGFDRLESAFNNMTTAVLDAMNRQTDRYDRVQTTQTTQDSDVRELRQRLENLEKVVYKKAS